MTLHPLIAGLLPELILVFVAALMIVGGAVRRAPALALLALFGALVAAIEVEPALRVASLRFDALTAFVRVAVLAVGAVIVLVSRHVPHDDERGEFFALLLFSLAGTMLVASADDLILFFLALELVSIPTYILVALSRTDIRASEAGVKYFFLGSFAAAILLYGLSFLYGVTGTTTLFGVSPAVSIAGRLASSTTLGTDPLTLVGLLLVIAGLCFKLAAVPFHFYAPDVYQGAAAPVAGMLGFVPKLAGVVGLVRILSLIGWELSPPVFWLLFAIAVATMTVGNLLALMQNNAKRMLAYSSIAHSGYLLVALLVGPGGSGDAAPTRNGVSAALFYIAVYALMNLGAFAALALVRGPQGEPVEEIDDLAGAARYQPGPCLALAICALGLMGLPPTGGFLGKLYIFSAAFAASGSSPHASALVVLVVIAVVNAAISAAYYLRLIATCYLRPAAAPPGATHCHALRTGLALCAVAVLALFAFPGAVSRYADAAGRGVRPAPAARVEYAEPVRAAAPR